MTMKKFLQWLIKPLLPMKLYVGGTGSGSFYGLSNLKYLDKINIQWPTQEEEISSVDMTNAAKNAGYSKDTRTGSTSDKNSTYELDTTGYDAKIADLQAQLNNYKYWAVGKNTSPNYWYNKTKSEEINNQISNLQKNKEQYLRDYANSTTLDKSTTQADQALRAGQQSAQQTAAANASSNSNVGINKSAAGLLGSQNASQSVANTANNVYSAARSNSAATQADYLEKMSQANALDLQAKNTSAAAGSAALGGALTGMSSGMALGSTISDENMKESPDEPSDELIEMVDKFIEMYDKLQELKRRRS